MKPAQIVIDFCNAVPRRNVEELIGFFSDDAVYHNIPIAPVSGHEAIAATLRGFLEPATAAEFEVRALAADGRVVLTERIDRFTINGKTIALPVMGAFEIDAAGKISAWRDYFDLAQFTKQMG
jgi:limonene-1,2-epoxide hydrolase